MLKKLLQSLAFFATNRPTGFRLSGRIGAYVFLSILAVEAAVLVPIYQIHERYLVMRVEQVAWEELVAARSSAADAANQELRIRVEALVQNPVSSFLGASIYDLHGTTITTFGTAPGLTPGRALSQGQPRELSVDGRTIDVLWEARDIGLPYMVGARLDASWVTAELRTFITRVGGFGLLIAAFVCLVTMAILMRSVLMPLLALRHNLTAARDDPARADSHRLHRASHDELGDVFNAVNALLERVAQVHREELSTMTAMASQASDAILAYDGAGKLLYANPACVTLCGFATAAQMSDANLPQLRFDGEPAEVTLPASLADGPYSRAAWMIARAGDTIPVFVNAARPAADSESVVQFYASITDISELRAAQERLKHQNLELESANRAKSEFLTNMSHELRTPLNAIIGFSEVLRDGLFGPLGNPRYTDYADDIHASGGHLLNIINDILDLAKIEAGKMELKETEVGLADLVEAVLPLVRGRAETGELTLQVAIPDNLPMVYVDPRAVKQILINLLSNAIKFTKPGGKVTVSAKYEKNTVAIAVTDTGVGISKADIASALSAFGQVEGSLDRSYEGTGLGLPLVTSLANLHGAVFKLDSAPDKGTTAIVTFPSRRTLSSPMAAASRRGTSKDQSVA